MSTGREGEEGVTAPTGNQAVWGRVGQVKDVGSSS